MNSVKNAIVTMTLLAVGYGAYVVLSNPVPDDLGELADGSVWEPPEVTAPVNPGLEAPAISLEEPPALADLDQPLDSPSPEQDAVAGLDPINTPDPRHSSADPVEPVAATDVAPPQTSLPAFAGPDGSPNELQPPVSDAGGRSTAEETNQNYYVSRSDTPLDPPADYPSTAQPELPFPDGPSNRGLDDSTNANSGFEATWQNALGQLRNGQLGTALASLSAWYEEPTLTTQQQEQLVDLLDQLAGTVIYSRNSLLDPAHVVQQGDTLEDLAQQYQVPVEFLARINGIAPPYELFPGETIKVISGPFRAEVSRRQNQITIFLGRYYAGRFQARLGTELPTEDRVYDVVSVDPGLEFFDAQTGERIGPDHPDNPYGDVWIRLRGDQITAAHHVGIHVDRGDPQRCCVAVNPADANDLAAILGPGSTVEVKP